ncbi:MAG: amidohydrolase [Halieaceae bacterium]|jgi:predicted amidohydrolase YtcJ|nr:amidohydrolase [Halieaceae bacterium]
MPVMRTGAIAWLLVVLIAACGGHLSMPGASVDRPADIVFKGGAVYTVDANRSWATAVAVRDGRIVFVGHDDGLAEFEGPDTVTVSLAGRMLMPSFQDIHIHPILGGMQALSVDLSDATSLEDYQIRIRQYADTHPQAPWILGGGWSMAIFGPGGKASKKLIDDIVPNRPVYLTSSDGHSGWANSKALALAGIDEDTPNPARGIIDRDPNTGEIIGSLQEGAMALVASHIPAATPKSLQAGLSYANKLLNSYGITAITDASVYEADLNAYRALDQRDELSLRVIGSMWWEPALGLEQIENFKRMRTHFTGGNLRASTIKIMQDGVLENYTAAMSEPYYVDGDPSGIPMVEPAFLKKAVTALDAEGFQVHFHAIGDAAITQSLDAVEAAIKTNGNSHRRHHISHLQIVHPSDIPRFRELDVIANFQPLWAYADEYVTELNIPFIGEERGSWMYPIRSVVNSGGMIAFGSDWFVSSANPLPQIETAVTRTDAGGSGAPFIVHETIDLQTAVAAFTINSAYVNGIEDVSGSIEVGKYADLIVVDRNLFAIPVEQISDAKVLLTLFGGEPVHGDPTSLGNQGSAE